MAINSLNFMGYIPSFQSLEDQEEMHMKNKLDEACREGNVKYVKTCLETKKEWVMKYPEFLHSALQTGNTEIAKLLLSAGMGADHMHTEGRDYLVSALIFFIYHISSANENNKNNQKEIIRLLIEKGANIEGIVSGDINTLVFNAGDTTVLLQAIASGELDLIRDIVDKAQADIEVPDEDGDTPLLVAIQSGKIEAVEILVKSGANIDAVNLKGETSLILAINERNPGIVKTLLSLGAYVDEKDKNGSTPLHNASSNSFREMSTDRYQYDIIPKKEIVQALLEKGADPIALNNIKATPLHAAAVYGNIEIGQLILESAGEKKLSHNKKRKFSHVTLFPKVEKMIARENLLNSQDIDGNTSLHKSIQICNLNIFSSSHLKNEIISRKKKFAQWIIGQLETDLEIKNISGKTPLDIAKENKDEAIVAQIEKKRKGQS